MNRMTDERPDLQFRNELTGKTVTGNLDYRIASALCYTPLFLIGIIASIVWIATEPKANKQVRFHAIQSLTLCGCGLAFALANTIIVGMLAALLGSGVAGLVSIVTTIISLGIFAASLYGMYAAYNGIQFKFPILGDIAERNC